MNIYYSCIFLVVVFRYLHLDRVLISCFHSFCTDVLYYITLFIPCCSFVVLHWTVLLRIFFTVMNIFSKGLMLALLLMTVWYWVYSVHCLQFFISLCMPRIVNELVFLHLYSLIYCTDVLPFMVILTLYTGYINIHFVSKWQHENTLNSITTGCCTVG